MSNPNAFLDTLRELRGGVSLEELSEQLHTLVNAVRETGKSGQLFYRLTVKPATAGSGLQLIIGDEIKVKTPVLARSEDIFFSTAGGELTRKNPNQRELELREVTPAEAPIKDVANG